MSTTYQIGDTAWYVTFDSTEDSIPCPECGETRTLKVTLFDGTEHTIDCAGCARGAYPATGRVPIHVRKPRVVVGVITGIEIKRDTGEETYRINVVSGQTYIGSVDRIGKTEAEGLEKSATLAAELDAEDKRRALGKERDERTWAWNVHYYRQEIRRAREDIKRFTAKLSVGQPWAKEEREAKKEAARCD